MIINKKLLYLGFIIPPVFWVTIFICGLMTENYNHLINMVSELGTIGTKTQYIFTAGLVLVAILSVLFIAGLYKTAKKTELNVIPILLMFTFSFSVFGAGIFPLPLNLHGILGSPSMLLPLSPLLAMFLWREDKIAKIKIATGIIFVIMLLGFLTSAQNILDNYFGLKQRFFHTGWSLWFVYLSLEFIKLEKNFIQNEITKTGIQV